MKCCDFLRKLSGCKRSCVVRVNAGILAATPLFQMAQDQWPQLREYLPANLYGYAFVVIVIVNILLRFKTKLPLEDK